MRREEGVCADGEPMCLMLYLGSDSGLSECAGPDLYIEPVGTQREAVLQWFTRPRVQFIGGHGRCSCAFPSVVAEEVIEHSPGYTVEFNRSDDDRRSISALIEHLQRLLGRGERIELYPVWDGDQRLHPKGHVDRDASFLDRERLFFNERFLYRLR